ncbi:glycosyl transferase family 1 [Leptolyngbya sp. 'hensonii']|uniref:glycosyltransferase family 4 protein n=1 Tax=Leptolyngbya sp. 'hensonii' TaxID=1922337 RepID=UPI00094F6D2E|nr:glycosyltransferase family 4 protein [Leptolyngbya sp. 'hensonii']OLP20478.1 glycosyl transferase family 1 [Leptolyngbya sp. 'hensonii']
MVASNPGNFIASDQAQDAKHRHLMLFELSVGGHYPGYIQHLVQYWRDQHLTGKLTIVVSPKFIEQHADVVESAAGYEQWIRFISVTTAEAAALVPRKSPVHRAVRAFQMWCLLCKYAASVNASHCLIMYLDSFQTPLAVGTKAPCSLSGIYFRPTFHYNTLSHYDPSWKDRIQQWREKLILPHVFAHPQLQTVFCLDPFVIQPLSQFCHQVRVVSLSDPVQIYPHSEDTVFKLQEALGIQPNRLVFLMFGALDERKGIHQLLEATLMLPPELCQKLCLLFVGPIKPQDKIRMQPQLTQLSETLGVQILIHDKFVSDHEIQPYFQLADVVLALYQRHVGMSAILARAATAQTPVLASDYGLMGEITQYYGLGLTVDSMVPAEIAQGLTQLLTEPPAKVGDRAKMYAFAEQNSAECYAKTIFEQIGSNP